MINYLLPLIVSIESCPEYTYRPFEYRREILTRLPDNQQLSNLSLIGTHKSMATTRFWFADQYQTLSLNEQLDYGVRVFDIGVRATTNSFAIHNQVYFLDLMFGRGVFRVIEKFLIEHPKELVILILHQEYEPNSDVTLTNCQILEGYRSTIGRYRMELNWSLKDTVGQHRGKILLATNGDPTFSGCTVDLREICLGRNQSLANIENLWDSITDLQRASFDEFFDYKCFVYDLTDRFDGQPEATAVEGRVNGRNKCAAPINYRMAEFFKNPHRGLVVVIADLITQELIDRVNNSN